MNLKIRFLKWSAGLPVAMLNKKTAEKMGVHVKDRISIKTLSKNPKKISTIIDIIEGVVKRNEIAVSSEIKEIMGLREKQRVEITLTESPKSIYYIRKKLDKKTLSKKEIQEIIKDIVNNSLSEAEIALFISAMYRSGTNMGEVVNLAQAIFESGNKLSLKGKYLVDKHSIGGIAGNRTTPLVVAICAAAGLIMPKTSSKAITSAAGTADVIETIAKIEFTMPEVKKIVKKTGGCMVWGGALGMTPADSKIIRIEKVLKIDPEAQLLASIISKKLAVGSKYILIDIPYGKSAKVSKSKALKLKKKFEYMGRYFKKKLKVVLTDGKQPIGNGIGPALELIDIIKIFDPKQQGPKDLEKKSLFLAGEIMEMSGKFKKGEGLKKAKEILYSGEAFKKFKEIIKAQKGSLSRIKSSKYKKNFCTKKSGKVLEIDNKKINALARITGCPVDKSAGIYLEYHLGHKVKKGEKLLTLYSNSKTRLNAAIKFCKDKKPIRIR